MSEVQELREEKRKLERAYRGLPLDRRQRREEVARLADDVDKDLAEALAESASRKRKDRS